MSRIGKKPIPIPPNVNVKVGVGSIEVKGPMGSVNQLFPETIKVEVDEKSKLIWVKRPNDEKQSKAFQGLTRSLIANAVLGVVQSFKRELLIVGTGYNAKLKGKHLELQVGFCHPITLMIPDGVKVELPNPTKISLTSCDKHAIGQFAANIRKVRPVEPYKGKGIHYSDEVVKIKARKGATTSGKA